MSSNLSIQKYTIQSWNNVGSEFKFESIIKKNDWRVFLKSETQGKKILELEKIINNYIETKTGETLYPYPKLVFNSFNLTTFKKTKVVILGQDPYHGYNLVDNKIVPEAMGLSFSIPNGMKIPSSLKNIYKNLLKFSHIDKIPKDGNLSSWASQGVLLINTAFTVHQKKPNSHTKYWKTFSENLIKYISKNKENVIFVLWGRPALSKKKLIDSDKNFFSISSHPSGLSCNKTLGDYKSFMDTDHFGFINKKLKELNKKEIQW
jgi:uracil-DNA glycosylase